MDEREPKEGELWSMEGGAGWCRHGLVVIQAASYDKTGELFAVDTYWGSRSSGLERNFWPVAEVRARLTFILDLNQARKSHREEWETYAEKHRAYIPQGGGSAQFYVLKDAKPDFRLQVEQLESRIQKEERAARSAINHAMFLRGQLAQLMDSRVHSPLKSGPCAPACATCAAALAGAH